ncbi:FadR/GntR family transcriptional regulator [Syntrophomonas curvata]
MGFQAIKTRKIYEEIVEQLTAMITGGELIPGDKLPSEREMADSLQVSRASVREALTALEAIGILDIRPGEGTFVRQTNLAEVFQPLALVLAVEKNPARQLMEVRRVLESEAAALAAMRSTPEDTDKIAQNLDQMKSAASIREAVKYDLRFHFSIAEAARNSVLLRLMNTVADLMHHNFRDDREQYYAEPTRAAQVIEEHEAILTAIRDREPELARGKMIEHINCIETGLETGR